MAAAALSNGASVVIASSSQARVDGAVERLKKGIEGKDGVIVVGQAFDIKDYSALTGFLTKEAPFDHLVSAGMNQVELYHHSPCSFQTITAGQLPKGPPKPGVDLREQLQDGFE